MGNVWIGQPTYIDEYTCIGEIWKAKCQVSNNDKVVKADESQGHHIGL